MAQSAQERVRKALEEKLKGEIDGIEPESVRSPALPGGAKSPTQLLVKGNEEADILIDGILGRTNSPPSLPSQRAPQKQQQQPVAQTVQQRKPAQPVAAIAQPAQQKIVVAPQQQQQQQKKKQPQATQAQAQQPQQGRAPQPKVPQQQQQQQPPKAQQQQQQPQKQQQQLQQQPPAKQQQQQQQKQQPQQQQQQQPPARQQQQSGAPAVYELKRKLESQEVEVVGKALEFLVKHRCVSPSFSQQSTTSKFIKYLCMYGVSEAAAASGWAA